MPASIPTCSDLLGVFNKAREAAGDQAAIAVINRLGARYAATVAPKDYAVAIGALTDLIRRHEATRSAKPTRKAAA